MNSAAWPLWWQGRLWTQPPPMDPRWPAFAQGVAVFETLGVRAGVPWLLERHLTRLQRAAAALAPDVPLFERRDIEQGLRGLLQGLTDWAGNGPEARGAWLPTPAKANPGPELSSHLAEQSLGAKPGSLGVAALNCAVRISLGLGDGPLCYLTARPMPQLPEEGFRLWPAPAEMAVAAGDPAGLHKHVGRFLKERAQRAAHAAGCFEALLPSTAGGYACCSRGNLYAHLDGAWWTPPLSHGALPGITRGLLLEAGLVQERPLDRTQLAAAAEVALSNALWLFWPARSLFGDTALFPGTVGPRWRELAGHLRSLAHPGP